MTTLPNIKTANLTAGAAAPNADPQAGGEAIAASLVPDFDSASADDISEQLVRLEGELESDRAAGASEESLNELLAAQRILKQMMNSKSQQAVQSRDLQSGAVAKVQDFSAMGGPAPTVISSATPTADAIAASRLNRSDV